MRLTQYFDIDTPKPVDPAAVVAHFLNDQTQAIHAAEFETLLKAGGLTVSPGSLRLDLVVDDEALMWGMKAPRWRLAISAEVVAS